MKISRNVNLLILIALSILFYVYSDLIFKLLNIQTPFAILIVSYFTFLSLIYKRFAFLRFLLITFILLTLYLTYIKYFCLGKEQILAVLSKKNLPFFLYCNFLLPGVFFSSTADFYSLVNEITSMAKINIVYFLISILIKKELINHRYNAILEGLYTRGYNTKSIIKKYLLIPLWIIPLFITTLIEGIESYEYNQMLKTNIFIYRPNLMKYYISFPQKLILTILLGLFLLRIILK